MKYRLKLKEEESNPTVSEKLGGWVSSEYSITQKELRDLEQYLLDQYKKTGQQQFKRWATLVNGHVIHAYGRNIRRGVKIGKSIYRLLAK